MLFAPCALGLEGLLATELRSFGADRVRESRAGVSFEGALEIAYRACLWSRFASRVLLRIAEVPAGSPEELYESVKRLPWEEHLALESTFAVDFTASRSPITHTHFGALKVKDAIVDRYRDRTGDRPNVDTDAPDLRINIAARARSAVVSIDLSGDALHRRGYREQGIQVEAPLKETLAAAVLTLCGWPELAERGAPLFDPMCGSGTLVIEAALMATDRAPGLLRARWGFDGWLAHDSDTWHSLLDEADERAERGLVTEVVLQGSDHDKRAISIATACAKRAGVASVVNFALADARQAEPPAASEGLVVINPPYGGRLVPADGLESLYREVGAHLRASAPGWRIGVIAADDSPVDSFGVPAEESYPVRNGRIPATVRVGAFPPSVEDSMFANRLKKNYKRLRKWARKADITCYRVYDADMPEYAVAIDLYEGAGPDAGSRWVYVAEYASPKTIDPAAAARRLSEAMIAIPEVLDVPADAVTLRRRQRQRGSEQYERAETKVQRKVVSEGGLLFAIDLDTYLDTGLFLDHRMTRSMVRERAAGMRFCNLFGYTGSVSAYAAAGGAAATTTVDLSATYLKWAEHNFRLNDLIGPEHTFVRADVAQWLEAQPAGSYDLVFCDPPTFSNSKRMDDTFDVQRDYVALVTGAARLLAPGGELWFSTNRRGFKLDPEALSGLDTHEFTAETVPEDFARRPMMHRIWRVTVA